MPLEPPEQQFFEAACGYAQLGMFLDANEELEKVDPFNRAVPEILALRIDVQWTVSLAYTTRRANSIEAAKKLLLNAESKFPTEACYFCQTGDIETAQRFI